MGIDDALDRALEEERPGPSSELVSVLAHDTLAHVKCHPPLILDPETKLAETLRQMKDHRRGCALLVKDQKLVGIFTERDVLMKVAGNRIDVERTPVSAYMTRDPETLPVDAVVAFALNKMILEGYRHIPFVDGIGRPVGVVSMRDIIEYLSEIYRRDVLNLPPKPNVATRHRDGA